MPKEPEVAPTMEEAAPKVTMEDLMQVVAALAEEVKTLKSRPATPAPLPQFLQQGIPETPTTKQLLAGMRVGESRQGSDFREVRPQAKLRKHDVVRLTDPDKREIFARGDGLSAFQEDGELYGVIKRTMLRNREGEYKFSVDFGPPIGEDGVMEAGLELVARS